MTTVCHQHQIQLVVALGRVVLMSNEEGWRLIRRTRMGPTFQDGLLALPAEHTLDNELAGGSLSETDTQRSTGLDNSSAVKDASPKSVSQCRATARTTAPR